MKRVIAIAVAVAALGTAAGCGGSAKAAAPTHLNGLFRIAPGRCAGGHGKPSGSYLIVISAARSRAVRNPRNRCANHVYTLLRPGTEGGLTTGRFQPEPSPAFDARRNSTATHLIAPVAFGPYLLGFATNSRDEQDAPSGAPAYPAPSAIDENGTLDLDLRSLVMTYAGNANATCRQSYGVGCWNLGSRSAQGTYDAATHHFIIDWLTGEAFVPTGDSIAVHLEGTLVPRAAA
jgi:hypothetical protein